MIHMLEPQMFQNWWKFLDFANAQCNLLIKSVSMIKANQSDLKIMEA